MRGTRSIAAIGVMIATAALGAETRVDYGLSAALGRQTNPLRVSGDGPDGTFTQLVLDGSASHILGPTVALFASGAGRIRLHEASVRDADHGDANLRAGVGFAPRRIGDGRLTLAAGGRYGVGRSTFVDRATGGVYEVAAAPGADPGTTVPIPGRFDVNDYGVFFNARWNQNRKVRLFFDARWNRSDYVNDYSADTDLLPLDFRSLTLEPGINLTFGQMVSVGFSVALTDQDYDARPSLDENGDAVAGTSREYRYAQFRTTLMITPGPRWNVEAGLRADDRHDAYAGYYDYGARSVYAAVRRQLATPSSLRLYASWSDLDYDKATIPESPELVRGTDARAFILRYEHRLGRQLLWFADLGDRGTHSQDPVFAYDQRWFLSGIQFRR